MAKLIAYIGLNRNNVLNEMGNKNPITTHILEYNIKANAVDLRDNLQSLFNALGLAYDNGRRDITILNVEAGLEVIYWSVLEKIKKHYDGLILRYSTTTVQYCWCCDEIIYNGNKNYVKNNENDVYLNRIRYGNVLDGYGTELLTEI